MKRLNLTKFQKLLLFFTAGEFDPEPAYWTGKVDYERDEIISTTMILLEKPYRARRLVWIKDYYVISGTTQISILFDLLDRYSKLRSIQSILGHQIPARVTPKGKLLFHGSDQTPNMEGMHPRQMRSTVENFPFWKEDIIKTGKEALISTKLSQYAPRQREMQDLEHNKFFEKFIKITEIAKMFEKKHGISLTIFRDVTLAMKRIALSSTTSTVSIIKPRLVSKLKKMSCCSRTEIERVLDMFIIKAGYPVSARCIFTNGIEYIYSWSILTFPLDNMMSELYDEWNDGNKKGLEFEADCREILRSGSCVVLDDRLQISPLNSDIDVVGEKNDILFVLECKSELRKKKRKTSQLHEFERYYKKLLKKAEWISKNFDIFSELLNDADFPTQNVKIVVPLLVTRIMKDSPSLLTVSTSELKEIVSKISTSKNRFIEIVLDSNVVIHVSAFQIKNSTDM